MAIDFSKYGTPVDETTALPKVGMDFSKYGSPVDQPISSPIQQPEDKSFLTSEGPSFKASLGGAETIMPNIAKSLGNIPSSARDLTKAAISPVNPFDIESPINIGANIVGIAKTATDIFKKRGFKEGAKDIGEGFADTYLKIGETIYGGLDKAYNAFLDNPEEAIEQTSNYIAQKAIEDPLFIPTLLYGPKAAKGRDLIADTAAPITRGADTSIAAVGQKTLTSGETGVAANKQDFVRDLVRPVQNKATKEAQVARTTETGIGPFKRSEIAPSPQEARMEQAVIKVPGVSESKTMQQNYNVIRDHNTKLAKDLEAKIAENEVVIPKRESKAALQRASDNLSESPLITGDAEKTANKLLAKANQLIDEAKGTNLGVYKARQKYDQWVITQKPKAFDARAENAFTIANREVRDAMNKLVDDATTDVPTKALREEQSSLYSAMENITPKAAIEADTAIMRAMQRIGEVLGTKSRVVQAVAAAVGIGGLGAAATFAPIVAFTGIPIYLTYRGGKLLLKPEVRVALGNLLKKSGDELPSSDVIMISNILKEYSEEKTLTE